MSSNNNNNISNAHQSSPPTADAADVDAAEVANTNANTNANANAKNTIDFLIMARGLKTTPRTGWVLQKAGPRIESVADHSWRISLMAMVASSPSSTSSSSSPTSTTTQQYDTNRCIKMALVHDLAEATVGDISPHCGVSNNTKHELELRAITEMTQKLTLGLPSAVDDVSSSSLSSSSSNNGVGNEILELWKEYEEGATPEAKLVKDMDKLEMILQALEYENDGKNEKSLDGFFDSTRSKWKTPIGESWGKEIESRRIQRRNTQQQQQE